MRIHCLENVDKSLMFLNEQRVHLENMGAHDIVDGNPRLTLGLIWTIILRFQVNLENTLTRNLCFIDGLYNTFQWKWTLTCMPEVVFILRIFMFIK